MVAGNGPADPNGQWLCAGGSLYSNAWHCLSISTPEDLTPRWLILLGALLITSSLFGGGKPDLVVWGIPISAEAVTLGVKMSLSAAIIILAADGLAASVEITEMAGLFERLGLQGPGFSPGVAANMLPSLRQSFMNA
jgi:hypothetical protein